MVEKIKHKESQIVSIDSRQYCKSGFPVPKN